jgi:hypothetical protein
LCLHSKQGEEVADAVAKGKKTAVSPVAATKNTPDSPVKAAAKATATKPAKKVVSSKPQSGKASVLGMVVRNRERD